MKVTVHRGANQIGGNIIEVATDMTRIILDLGLELDQDEVTIPPIEGLFDHGSYDAVLISHYHGDHLGLAYFMDRRIPLYMGEASCRIIQAADEYLGRPTIHPTGFLTHGAPIRIGDITVTPYLCDHSAFDSYMLLCEADGETVLYTGDFRANGRKSFDRLLADLPRNVDKLICEGTTLSRPSVRQKTEADLEKEAVALFRKTKGPVFVLQSSTNIDRIVTMYRAAKRSGRIFLQETYMADVATAAGDNIPNPAFSDVYAFITNPSRYEALQKYHHRIGKADIAASNYVMCIRNSMLNYIKSLATIKSLTGGVVVYSMWQGYRQQPEMEAFLDTCAELGMDIISLHTSGHADEETIKVLIDHTSPKEIIPVHTERAEWFDQYGTPPELEMV